MSEQITPTPQGIDAFINTLEKHISTGLIQEVRELLLGADDESEQFTRAVGIIEYLRRETKLGPDVLKQLLSCLDSLRSSVGKKSQLN